MRFFTTIATFGLIAFASALDSNATTTARNTTSVSSTSAVAGTASLSPQVKCLQSCGSADVCCQAKCVGVPCPSQSQANATNTCESHCTRGNGTAADNQAYADCQASCISSFYMSNSTTAAPSATGSGTSSSASATNTATFGGSATSSTEGSASATQGSSATGASASASTTSSSGNGADNLHIGKVALGFLGLVMAGLAL